MGIQRDTAAQDRKDERGASLVEYVLLLAMIAIVCIAALTYFGGQSGNSLHHSCNMILTAGGNSSATSC